MGGGGGGRFANSQITPAVQISYKPGYFASLDDNIQY